MFEVRRWVTFLWMNVLAFVVAAGVFVLVLWADFLDGGTRAVAGWVARHPGWASLAAATPLLVTIAIGAHAARKGIRKRRAAQAKGAPPPRQRCMLTNDP